MTHHTGNRHPHELAPAYTDPRETGSLPRRHVLGALSIGAVAATSGLGAEVAAASTPGDHAMGRAVPRYPKGVRPTELYVVDRSALGDDDAITVATLQGLLARPGREHEAGPAIYFDLSNGYDVWLEDLIRRYRLQTHQIDDPWALVDRFAERVAGYVLYRGNDPTINVATTVAGAVGGIAVSEAMEETATAHGLARLVDVRDRDDAWALRTYGSVLRTDLAIEQKADPNLRVFTHQLRDYATMAGALAFYDGNSAFRQEVLDGLDPDASTLGWGDASEGESAFVSMSSASGVGTIPADWAGNLACLSGVPTARLRQRAPVRPRGARPNRHYASFVVSDGDNIQWMLNNLQSSPNWFASPRRGSFDLGWGVSPSMIDLAPSVLRWYYTHAARGRHSDRFVVGPSGGGYLYPSHYPRDELLLHTDRLATAMARSDLGVVQIIDFDAFDDVDLWATYLRHDQITGLVYLEYSRYDGLRGRVQWAHGKPIVSARTMLWDGLSSPDEVIATLNAAPADPSLTDGYSVVMMHAWSMTLDDIGYVVDSLAPHVSVVTPDALIALMTRHASR